MFLTIGSLNHHILLAGDRAAPALVLLHSLGTSSALWQAQIETLSRSHFVIAPDFRGHGLTEETDQPLTCDILAEDVMAVLAALSIGRFALAGISLGGVIAQMVASKSAGQVTGLAIFDSYIKTADPQMWIDRAAKIRADGLASIAPAVRKIWMPEDAVATPAGRGMARMLARCTDEGYAAACDALSGADCRSTTPALTCPTVIAYGSEDHAAPEAAAAALASAIPGAQRERIAGAGHLPLLTHPARCTEILRMIL